MSESGGVVILTPMELEYRAVRAQLQAPHWVDDEAGLVAEEGTAPEVPWPIAVVLAGEGTVQAAALAERAVSWFKPRALIVVGVAGSLRDDIQLGDVVVGTWVYSYHSGKEDKTGFHGRPRAWRASPELERAAHWASLKDGWTASLPSKPSVHFKPIAAGDVVLNSRQSPLAVQIDRHHNDAAAIEMESSGAAAAAQLNGSLPALTVRGISDKADGDKQLADAAGLQPIAAGPPAVFTMALLRELPGVTAQRPARPAGAGRTEPVGDSDGPAWRPLAQPLPPVWPASLGAPRPREAAALALSLIPDRPGAAVDARRLASLPAELTGLGQAAGLFGTGQEVSQRAGPAAIAFAGGAGLAVTRGGERCAWLPLPGDSLGAVLDPDDLGERLTTLLGALAAVDAPPPAAAGLAVAVTSSVPVAEGRVADLPRTRARGRTSRAPAEVPAADALPWAQISRYPDAIAAELAARLLLAFQSQTARNRT